MPDMKEIIKQIQYITYGAYGDSGQVAALLEEPDSQPETVAKALENTAARLARAALKEEYQPPPLDVSVWDAIYQRQPLV